MTDAKKLVEEIIQAFKDVPYPGDTIFTATSHDLEADDITNTFKNKHWQEISSETLRYHAEAIFFFSPQGLAFYLPAYLIASITAYRETDNLTFIVIGGLTLPQKTEREIKWFHDRIALLTMLQRNVILKYLKYIQQAHGNAFATPKHSPQIAIKRFWGKYD